jgi:hypothetical protein
MSAGKGDNYRPVDREKWEQEYERIFGPRRWRKLAPTLQERADAAWGLLERKAREKQDAGQPSSEQDDR